MHITFSKHHKMSPHTSTFIQLQYRLWRGKQTIYFMKSHSNSSPHLETKSSKPKNKTNINANPTVIIWYFNLTRYFDVCQVCIELDTILDISVNLQMLFRNIASKCCVESVWVVFPVFLSLQLRSRFQLPSWKFQGDTEVYCHLS